MERGIFVTVYEEKGASLFSPVRIENRDGTKPTVEREMAEKGAGPIVPVREATSTLLKDLSVWK